MDYDKKREAKYFKAHAKLQDLQISSGWIWDFKVNSGRYLCPHKNFSMVKSRKYDVGCMQKCLPDKHCQRMVAKILIVSAALSDPIAQGLDQHQ